MHLFPILRQTVPKTKLKKATKKKGGSSLNFTAVDGFMSQRMNRGSSG